MNHPIKSSYRIGVDLSLLSQFSFTGIVTYARCLLPHLFRATPQVHWILFAQSAEALPAHWAEVGNVEIRVPKTIRAELVWKTVGLPWETKIQKLDLLFMPVSRAPLVRTSAVVTCIHDLGYLTQPQHLKRGSVAKTAFAIRHAIKTSDVLIAGSEFTRKEICSGFKVDPARVKVAYYGYDSLQFHPSRLPPAQANAILAKYAIQKPYVLYLGIIQGRKNLVKLIEAAQIWREALPGLQLVLAGKRGWNCEQIYEAAASYSDQQVILPGVIAEEDVCVLYQEAECFVLPSLYEGFGIPVIEAMSCGCPAILSNVAALPETGGLAALYFDPTRSDQIADCVLRVMRTPNLRERMVDLGFEHVRSFTWEQCAARTLLIFNSLMPACLSVAPTRSSSDGANVGWGTPGIL